MSAPIHSTPCLPCAWLRRAGRVFSYLLLPRVFALLCALVIVGLMAPTSMPKFVKKAARIGATPTVAVA